LIIQATIGYPTLRALKVNNVLPVN